MLAFNDSGWVEWTGQQRPSSIDEQPYTLPYNAESVYSDEELAIYGLHRVTVDPIPEGKQLVSYTLEDDDGTPRRVDVLEDTPLPPLEALNAKQIRLGLLAMGITEQDIEAKLALLDEPEKTQALIAWRYAPSYVRTDPLLVQIAAAMQLDDATIDEFWRAAMAL